jgi:hypothetical protein
MAHWEKTALGIRVRYIKFLGDWTQSIMDKELKSLERRRHQTSSIKRQIKPYTSLELMGYLLQIINYNVYLFWRPLVKVIKFEVEPLTRHENIKIHKKHTFNII